ncbi:MAG: bifunctional glutathionylspermidine amidase/synthase, partial [Bdellovibrionales bacterium]|nr:bifunctional glutathionylspermidine amidase/synthase [Bdellovibrionales bacterium]
ESGLPGRLSYFATDESARLKKNKTKEKAKFGTILGYAPGDVAVYSSDYDSVDSNELPTRHTFKNYLDGIYMGYKWQCVEFARRWLYVNYGYVFNDIAMAYDIFKLSSVRVVKDSTALPLHSFRQGSLRHPVPGSLLVWEEGGHFENTGHVAIVTEVLEDRIRIAEQNNDHSIWPEGHNYSRELHTSIDEKGGFWIECYYQDANILGWVIQTADASHAEVFDPLDNTLLDLQLAEARNRGQATKPWLNIANEDEAAYVAIHLHSITDYPEKEYRYFKISESALTEVKRASNELHFMFLHATDHVLQHESLLERFCIPRLLWPRLKRSWDNRKNQAITGRLDFSVSSNGIKLYEYNADSAACYMECGVIQNRWAKHFGCRDGRSAGERLHRELVDAWKESEVSGTLHILQDEDPEETYHALFMKRAIEAAGIDCKVIKGLEELRFGKDGAVLDGSNERVRWVWKTWAWETALDQIREECEQLERLDSLEVKKEGTRPRLVDVLLNEEVMVFEPFWTLIPSNKAILPILWEMYPGHRNLLNSQFRLTPELAKQTYVSKPIVGRCGSNIEIFNKSKALIEKTEGQFEDRSLIYQEFFPLPQFEGDNVQLSSFMVNGVFAGAGVRSDPSLILVSNSDLPTLWVVDDDDLLKK